MAEVLPLLRRGAPRGPLRQGKYTIDATHVEPLADERTIGVAAVRGTTFTGHADDIGGVDELLVSLRKKGLEVPLHVDAASGGFVWPFLLPEVEWDFGRAGYGEIIGAMADNARYLADQLKESGRFELIGENLPQLPLIAFRLTGEPSYDEFDVSAQLAAERGWMVRCAGCDGAARARQGEREPGGRAPSPATWCGPARCSTRRAASTPTIAAARGAARRSDGDCAPRRLDASRSVEG